MRWTKLAAGQLALAAVLNPACTPDIDTDPLPEVAEFDPAASPPRVSEPTLAIINPATGLIDLRATGVVVPADCHTQMVMPEAQCEFDQYLQSLDGFPTTGVVARTPFSAALDPATTTVPTNVAAVQVQAGVPALVTDATLKFDDVGKYLEVHPKADSWPSGALVWIGVRGYANGVKTTTGSQVVASVPYNLLKRDESLFCKQTAATVDASCGYFALLAQQMAPEAARASLGQLESLRTAMNAYHGWELLAGVGIPKAEAAVLWGFPTHSGPVIELRPPLQVPVVKSDEIQLAVNGAVDPATVIAFQPTVQAGSVYLMNIAALMMGNLRDGFPEMTATFANGVITLKTAAPLVPGGAYAVIVSNQVKGPTGKAMVAPPVSVFLKSRGALSVAGKSQVSSLPDEQALALETMGRAPLVALLDNAMLGLVTGLNRGNISYLFAFTVEAP
jgi:hypothetical protein